MAAYIYLFLFLLGFVKVPLGFILKVAGLVDWNGKSLVNTGFFQSKTARNFVQKTVRAFWTDAVQFENRFWTNCGLNQNVENQSIMKENSKPVQKATKKTTFQKGGLFEDSNDLLRNFEWDFNRWAKNFYKGNAINLGFEVNGLMNDFLKRHPRSKMVCDMRRFKKQLILWCGKNGYKMNPHRAGMTDTRDRINGFDYFVVANDGFELRHLKRVKLEL